MRKLAAQIMIATAASSVAFAQTPSVNDEFSTFAGWWREESDIHACEERKVDRLVSISRSQYGASRWHIETPNGSCELSKLTSVLGAGGTIQTDASCPPATGTHSGIAEFFQLSSGRFYVETPIFDGVLFSCDGFVPPEIQNVAAPQSQASAVAALEALTGWWRYDNATFGCDDTDGMTRTLLGRYDFDDNWELIAGDGPLRFGFYEGECELTDAVFRDGKLAATAMCVSEGEASKGRVTIEAVDDTSILVTTPVLTGANLVACEPGQMAGIAALPLPVPASADNRDAGSANADSATSAPVVESPPQPGHTVATGPSVEAQYLNPQRNALAKVLADYCQPDFFQYNHWGDGKWDAAFYDRYKQQLLVRYLSNCVQMHSSEFLPFTVMDDMLARNPNLFPAGQAALPAAQAQAVGFYLQMRNMADLEQCVFGPKEQVDPQLDQGLAALLSRATQADQFAVAQGYQAADQMVGGVPLPAGDGVNCTARPMILPLLTQLAFTSGAFIPRTYGN